MSLSPKPARWRPILWGAAVLMLLAPAAAMLVWSEMNWGPGDFAIFGGLLLGVCLAIEAAMRFVAYPPLRLAIGLTAVTAFLLIWAHLAVGIW